MILRPSTIVWVVMWVVAAFGLYMVKYKVQAVKVEVASAERQLREESKNLHVLEAEWTYLNRPERLQHLSAKYLPGEQPLHGQQLVDFAGLPYGHPAAVTQVSDDEQGAPATASITLASGAAHGH